ncbi:MAG: hypothetical protein JXJ04_05880, partial [Spirochaetales bacterium]|nr:hypothetical protein [Spirochaetales bacterium]
LSLLTFQNLNNIMINMNSVEHLGWEEARIKEIKRLFYFSRLLNKYIPLLYKFETGKIPDNFFPDYGIIYYIGRILLLLLFPERYNDILEYLGNNPGKSFSESESALDPKHVSAEFLGILILKLWNIPEELYEVIMNTSHPEKLNKKNNEIINLIHNIHKFITYLWQNKFTGKVKLSEIGFKTIPTDKLKSIIVEITEDMKSYK